MSEIVVLEDEAAVARELAERFVTAARETLAERPSFAVALTGGSTPGPAYRMLAAAPYRERVEWSRVRFFFGDERCVPPNDPDSNYRLAHDTMLGPLEIPPEHIFRLHGEDDPSEAAAAYARTLREQLGEPLAFDLLLLGMGPDGHTASLFPGYQLYKENAALVRPTIAPSYMKVAHRLTLTPHVLNAARRVVLATAGAGKAEILAQVLEGPYDPTRYPVQIVRPEHGAMTWIVDRAAAERLSSAVRV